MTETQNVFPSATHTPTQTQAEIQAPAQAAPTRTNLLSQAQAQTQPQIDQSATADHAQAITLDQLRAALSSARMRPSGEEVARHRERIATTPTPLDLLNLDILQPIVDDAQVQTVLRDVVRQHAPPNDTSLESLSDVLRSPALRAHAAAFSEALRSEQGWEVLRSFGVSSNPTNAPDALTAFLDELRRLQRQYHDSQQN